MLPATRAKLPALKDRAPPMSQARLARRLDSAIEWELRCAGLWLHQSTKAGLLEMLIGSKRRLNLTILHHDKRETVRQGPSFVLPRREQGASALEQLVARGHDLDISVGAQRGEQ